jgi:hypothetical protein
VIDGVLPSNTVTMSYHPANRLASASGPWGTASYSFDATGNRTLEQIGTDARTFAYPANSNRIASESLNAVPVRSFAHDGAGNLTAGVPQGSTYTLVYNKRNRPGALKLNGTDVATYLYNAQEQLARRVALAPLSPAGHSHYIHDLAGRLIAEGFGTTAGGVVITREYIWVPAPGLDPGDMPVMVVDNVDTASPVSYTVHADHLNRPIRMTDAARATVWQATWTPFGTAHAITGGRAKPPLPGAIFPDRERPRLQLAQVLRRNDGEIYPTRSAGLPRRAGEVCVCPELAADVCGCGRADCHHSCLGRRRCWNWAGVAVQSRMCHLAGLSCGRRAWRAWRNRWPFCLSAVEMDRQVDALLTLIARQILPALSSLRATQSRV